jgi:hypothetical protein
MTSVHQTTSVEKDIEHPHHQPDIKSIACWSFIEDNAVFLTFVIETGGKNCGIMQLSMINLNVNELFLLQNQVLAP